MGPPAVPEMSWSIQNVDTSHRLGPRAHSTLGLPSASAASTHEARCSSVAAASSTQ